MADKAGRVPNPKDFENKNGQSQVAAEISEREANLAKLAASAEKNNKAKDGAIDRGNNAMREVYENNWKITGEAAAEVKLAAAVLRKAKSHLGACYATAKGDGCNIKVMKKLREFQDLDLDLVDQEFRDVAWLADLVKSPVAKVVTFERLLEDADKANPYTQGYTAGRLGEDFNPPYNPGTDEFDRYQRGWKEAQHKLAQEKFGARATIRRPKTSKKK